MTNKTSVGYKLGRLIGKTLILGIGFLLGKKWAQKPIDKFPEK